jgi:hypothetical protein
MRCVICGLAILLSAAGCGYSGGGGTQGEVDFALENTLQEPRYVSWMGGPGGLVSCQSSGGIAGDCRFHPPGCTDECSQENLDQNCCMDCGAFFPSVKVINPGDSLMITWSGKLFPYDEAHCSDCECYRVMDTDPGGYRAEVCVYPEYTCDMPPCEGPDAQGVIMGASPSGTQTCIGIDFTVPYSKAFLILSIQ